MNKLTKTKNKLNPIKNSSVETNDTLNHNYLRKANINPYTSLNK